MFTVYCRTQLSIMYLLMVGVTIGLLGCANQIEPTNNKTSSNGGLNAGGGATQPSTPSAPPAPVDPWAKATADATGFTTVGGNQQQVTGLDRATQSVIIIIPMTDNIFPVGMQVEVTQLPGASLTVKLASDGKTTLLCFQIPIKYLLKGAAIGNPAALPNGDPLPQIAAGELPAMSLTVPIKGVNVTLYLGAEVLGIYVEVGFNPYVKLTFPIKTSGSQPVTLGYLSTVPVKQPYRGGFFLSVTLPNALARELDNILNSPN